MQMGKLVQGLTIFAAHALNKCRVIQFGHAVCFGQIAQLMQAPQDCLTTRYRELLPSRQKRLRNIGALLGRHLLPHLLPLAQFFLLRGRQSIPRLQILPDLSLLPRRKILEALVVLQEFLLIFRSHLLQARDRGRRKIICTLSNRSIGASCWRSVDIGAILLLLLTLSSTLLLCDEPGAPLREDGRAHQSSKDQRDQKSRRWSARTAQSPQEFEAQLHSLAFPVTGCGTTGSMGTGNSDSASNFESTS